jgi:hypothetical protein
MSEDRPNDENVITVDARQLERLSRRFAKTPAIKVDNRQLERLSQQLARAADVNPLAKRPDLAKVVKAKARPVGLSCLEKPTDLAEVLEPFRKQLAEMAKLPRPDAWDFVSELHWEPVHHESAAIEPLERMLEYARQEAEYAARAEERAQLAEARADRAEARDRRRDRFMVGSLVIGVIGTAGSAYTFIVTFL